MSISDTRCKPHLPVTGGACRAFVRVRRVAGSAAFFVATVGNAADDTDTSEGRCPR
jgi:hypothetical protein